MRIIDIRSISRLNASLDCLDGVHYSSTPLRIREIVALGSIMYMIRAYELI